MWRVQVLHWVPNALLAQRKSKLVLRVRLWVRILHEAHICCVSVAVYRSWISTNRSGVRIPYAILGRIWGRPHRLSVRSTDSQSVGWSSTLHRATKCSSAGTGIQDCLKSSCRKDCGSDSHLEYICACGVTVATIVLETIAFGHGGSIPLKRTKCWCGGMVYTTASKAVVERHGGSTPLTSTGYHRSSNGWTLPCEGRGSRSEPCRWCQNMLGAGPQASLQNLPTWVRFSR